jgi:hypothetical protein
MTAQQVFDTVAALRSKEAKQVAGIKGFTAAEMKRCHWVKPTTPHGNQPQPVLYAVR